MTVFKVLAFILVVAVFAVMLFGRHFPKIGNLAADVGLTRYGILVTLTLLLTMVFAAMLSEIWKLGEEEPRIQVAPFTVIDPSGDLKNAETGLTLALISRLNHIRAEIENSRKLLAQQSARDEDANAGAAPEAPAVQSVPVLGQLFPEGDASKNLELNVQGVDVTGIFVWAQKRLRPPTRVISFTANIGATSGITVGGDIKALKIPGKETVWIKTEGPDPKLGDMIDILAYRLLQHALATETPQLGDLEIDEFRELMKTLADQESPAARRRSPLLDKEQSLNAYRLIAGLLARFRDWPAMAVVAGDTAQRAGMYDDALIHFRAALASARATDQPDEDRIALLNDKVADAETALRASQKHRLVSAVAPGPGGAAAVRQDVESADPQALDLFLKGMAVLEDASAEPTFQTVSTLYQQYRINVQEGYLAWNRAFLQYVEDALRDEVPGFALLCWSFDTPDIPAPFTMSELAGGMANPLFRRMGGTGDGTKSLRNLSWRNINEKVVIVGVPTLAVAIQAPDTPSFKDFEGLVDSLFARRQALVGGGMLSPDTAPLDPLFYATACAADRLWAEWQNRHLPEGADPATLYDKTYLEIPLRPFAVTAAEVIDIANLGYGYDGLED